VSIAWEQLDDRQPPPCASRSATSRALHRGHVPSRDDRVADHQRVRGRLRAGPLHARGPDLL